MPAYIIDNAKYIAVFLGFLVGAPLAVRRREKLGLHRSWQAVLICLMFSVFSVLSAIVFAGFESLLDGNGFVFDAISTYGIYFICPFLIILTAKAFKLDTGKLMDVYALYAPVSLFFLRINCLISDCCGGVQIGHTGLFWPTRQLEMVFYVLIFLWLLHREKKGAFVGTAFPLFMTSYGVFRFIVEWVRETEESTAFHLAHWWSLAAFIIGISIYSELSNKSYSRGKRARGKERY